MNYNQRFFVEKLAEGECELKAAKIALKLLEEDKKAQEEIKTIDMSIESNLLYEVFTLRKLATIKEAESKIYSMRKALRTATEQKYKIDSEVEQILKEFKLDKIM